MNSLFLYSVSDVIPHQKGLLLLPGISQDRIANGTVHGLSPGTTINLRSTGEHVGHAIVVTFAVQWDRENMCAQTAVKSPIALVVQCDESIEIGTEIWLPEVMSKPVLP